MTLGWRITGVLFGETCAQYDCGDKVNIQNVCICVRACVRACVSPQYAPQYAAQYAPRCEPCAIMFDASGILKRDICKILNLAVCNRLI